MSRRLCLILTILILINHSHSYGKNLRTISSERPSKSDSVYTLNAHKFQFETSLYSLTASLNGIDRQNKKSIGEISTLRLGLNDNHELQIILNPFNKLKNSTSPQNNFGESFIRYKFNIFGNDGENFGLSMTPFYKINNAKASALNSNLKTGIAAPFHYIINEKFTIGGTYQANIYQDNLKIFNKYYYGFNSGYYLNTNLNQKLSTYVEFYSIMFYNHKFITKNYFDMGINYIVNPNLKVDLGYNIGISKYSDKKNYFIGFSQRL